MRGRAGPLGSPAVTDLPVDPQSIYAGLGVTLRVGADGRLTGRLAPSTGLCDRGVVPAYALVFLADVTAGVSIDTDPEAWAFTTEVSVRAPLTPGPVEVVCEPRTLRDGRRSSACDAPFSVDDRPWGHCFIGFSRVPRRPDDPVKREFDPATRTMDGPLLEEPLRTAAGFRSVDRAAGVVVADLRPALLNPAGAMQGAMVAGLAETAGEDFADHHHLVGAGRHVVTDIEVRYLAQNRVSPIATRAWSVGPPAEGLVRVDLVDDDGRGRLTTSALLKVAPAPT